MRLGVIGLPVGHSFSPSMHTSALRAVGLDWSYESIAVRPKELPEVIQGLRSPEWRGVNVTLPHKEAVLPLLDELDRTALEVGAANCITNREGRLVGSNTDVAALHAELDRLGELWAGRSAWILGCGGAARACIAALLRRGADVSIVCRHVERGERVVDGVHRFRSRVGVRRWSSHVFRDAPPDALIVNATPVGMWPHTGACPWPHDVPLPARGIVLDLVYNPPVTMLMRRARLANLPAVNGTGMLVEQGALAFESWTGRPAPRGVMRQAIKEVVEECHAEVSDIR